MYFDCVIDENMMPIFNSTPESVKIFAEGCLTEPDFMHYRVVVGETMQTLTLQEYVDRT